MWSEKKVSELAAGGWKGGSRINAGRRQHVKDFMSQAGS